MSDIVCGRDLRQLRSLQNQKLEHLGRVSLSLARVSLPSSRASRVKISSKSYNFISGSSQHWRQYCADIPVVSGYQDSHIKALSNPCNILAQSRTSFRQ
jgi:hypothetical protein